MHIISHIHSPARVKRHMFFQDFLAEMEKDEFQPEEEGGGQPSSDSSSDSDDDVPDMNEEAARLKEQADKVHMCWLCVQSLMHGRGMLSNACI